MSERKKPRVELVALNPFTIQSMQMETERSAQHELNTTEANALRAILTGLHAIVKDLPFTQARNEVFQWISATTAKWNIAADRSRHAAAPFTTRDVVKVVLADARRKFPELDSELAQIPSEAKCAELASRPGLNPIAVDFLTNLHRNLFEFDSSLVPSPPVNATVSRAIDFDREVRDELAKKYGMAVVAKVQRSFPVQACFRRPDRKRFAIEPDGRVVAAILDLGRHVVDFEFIYTPTKEKCNFERFQLLCRATPLPSRDPSDLCASPYDLFIRSRPSQEWRRLAALIPQRVGMFESESAIESFLREPVSDKDSQETTEALV